ncbi:MAG TPA: sigma-54 dependent transcriptional regulator [Steroidobacteraceae bacterium]|nr:sigma-54 dependent transcriptional regulator [Steroidobacteraceae bacterium]
MHRGAAGGLGNMLGESPAMQELFGLVRRVAATEASVLIMGETGVGKELVAGAIHELSRRSAGPMVAINCGCIPDSLIEAELFGYEKGAFTGASRAHAGVFERADSGTLLLDEITEMPIGMQTRLLRVLETGRFYRVGGTLEISTDVRILAATNQTMDSALRERQLREDVMYRLAVFPLQVPPLRERGGDVGLLAEHFLAGLNGRARTGKRFSDASRAMLARHRWPGNVRELRNVVERAFILADETLQLVPDAIGRDEEGAAKRVDAAVAVPLGSPLQQAERLVIEATLQHLDGNKRHAAQVLGCSLKTLYNKLHAYAATDARGQPAPGASDQARLTPASAGAVPPAHHCRNRST